MKLIKMRGGKDFWTATFEALSGGRPVRVVALRRAAEGAWRLERIEDVVGVAGQEIRPDTEAHAFLEAARAAFEAQRTERAAASGGGFES